MTDLTLMPEVLARAALRGRRVRFSVLAPVGAYAGVGTLRVLRASAHQAVGSAAPEEEVIELVCGYESYVALRDPQGDK